MSTRFFVDPSRIHDSTVILDSRDSHHLTAVLKRRVGDEILVCDGTGAEYLVKLSTVNKTESSGAIVDFYRLATEPATQITVAQALPRTLEKLEWVLQHGTELGATRFVPFHSSRSREDWNRLVAKRDRWQEIVRTAAEQSRRAICPPVGEIVSFSDVLSTSSVYDVVLFANENEKTMSLRSALNGIQQTNILIVVGPEGGFSDAEAQLATASGALSITLGPRILRTETAALCLISQILFALEPS